MKNDRLELGFSLVLIFGDFFANCVQVTSRIVLISVQGDGQVVELFINFNRGAKI